MSWLVNVRFRMSAVHGFGVFAGDPIKAGTRIWEVDGGMSRASAEELAALPLRWLKFALHGGYLHRPADCFVWYDDGMQYMNHAGGGRANAGLNHWPAVERDHTVALRDIDAGEELFEDYGFWADDGFAIGHWIEPLYRAACPEHLAFLRSLTPERIAA